MSHLFCSFPPLNPEGGKFKDYGIKHSLDMQHGAKNLAKKIATVSVCLFVTVKIIAVPKNSTNIVGDLQAAQVKGNNILTWLKDIVNHFWWCCRKAVMAEQFLVSFFLVVTYSTYSFILVEVQAVQPKQGMQILYSD